MSYSYFFRRYSPIVLHIYSYKCVLCADGPLKLQVHHIDKNNKNDSAYNLVPLCKGCHTLVHTIADPNFSKIQNSVAIDLEYFEAFRRLHT